MSPTRVEDGVVVGTSGDKYTTKNPIARRLVRGFDDTIKALSGGVAPSEILEIGCGEGHVTELLLEATTARIVATDISETMIQEVSSKIKSNRVKFRTSSAEAVEVTDRPNLVVCCEVLEHVRDPSQVLEHLKSIGAEWYIFSVPREPIWRVLNVARGAHIKELGNSPGHVNHWSKGEFLKMVGREFEVCTSKTPLPWTFALCRLRQAQ